jgi:putative endonuclease
MGIDRCYYVYILQCRDGSYYTGVTNNIERRLWEHETGYNASVIRLIRDL